MPTFCRHNHLIQNCPICAREQSIEARPLITSSAPGTSTRPARPRTQEPGGPAGRTRRTSETIIRRPGAAVDDGYRSALLPGLKSSESAQRLAEELAFAAARLEQLEHDPPGLYAELADPAVDLEERTWLAFLTAYLGPLEDAEDPFEAIRAVRTAWTSTDLPDLEGVRTGPRTAHDPSRGEATLRAYRAWAERAGSQAAGYRGEPSWTEERRFSRVFERLALPGFHRAARFELLVALGRTGCYELRAGALSLGGSDEVTLAAKRAFGIGDTMLLERRAGDLALACRVPIEALDLGLYNWARSERDTGGAKAALDPELRHQIGSSLGLG